MDTDERRSTSPGDVTSSEPPEPAARGTWWRTLSERLAAEIESMRAEVVRAHAARDAAEERLRDVYVHHLEGQITAWSAERERQTLQAELARARAHIARTQPLLRQARALLALTQDSKFWKARNAWFEVKKRLGRSATGAQPYWLPIPDETIGVWERDLDYERWRYEHRTRPADLERMRDLLPLLAQRPTFSVLMPVYETPEEYLRVAIESVQRQAYPNWELCIADDASKQTHVRRVLEECAAEDPRIKLVLRTENGHIAAASNSALALATGEFVALLDHDDALAPDALFENALVVNRFPDVDLIYSDEDKIDELGRHRDPYFKPGWSPDSLLSRNYVSHLGVYRRALIEEVGGFRLGFDGSQDYDLVLRVAERARRVEHIPRVLYHWRIHSASTASSRTQKSYAHEAAERALAEALVRRAEPGRVEGSERMPGTYTIRYDLQQPAKVSIIVPTRDHGSDVDRCFRSVFEKSTYADFEVILLDNGTTDRESLAIFGAWAEREPKRVKIVRHDVPFNFSAINNYAAAHAGGEYLLFLNNDTEVITSDWLEAMVGYAQRPSVGAIGAKLLYPDGTIQHGGVIVGIGGVAGHSHKYFPGDAPGYFATLQTVNNFSAVTAACLMVRKAVFDEIGGFDEDLAIAFNDVDFCLRVRTAGYYNVYLPHVELYHYESKSRGHENTPAKMERFLREQRVMQERWKTDRRTDPHYNRNLTLRTEDFALGP
jgi:GT2 family glycosyltransferase